MTGGIHKDVSVANFSNVISFVMRMKRTTAGGNGYGKSMFDLFINVVATLCIDVTVSPIQQLLRCN